MIKSMFHNTNLSIPSTWSFLKKVRFPLDTQKEYLNREWPKETKYISLFFFLHLDI